MNTNCLECGARITSTGGRGPTKRLCSARCRKRASRRRQAARPTFPAEMTGRRAWTRAEGKRPVMMSGQAASTTNPRTWATFPEVQDGAGDGFGIMLGGGLGCYDLDGALDDRGRLKGWARDVLEGIPEPVVFREVSRSGRGLHVFVLAEESPGLRRPMPDGGGVERYSRGRFILVTGHKYEGE